MRSDRRGDLGFMEAMVAMMVVTMALVMFMGVSSSMVSFHSDPMDMFDGDSLNAKYADGKVVCDNSGTMDGFLMNSGASGVEVVVRIPGFCDEPTKESSGTQEGNVCRRTFMSNVDGDGGRTLVAVFEVTAWFRTGGA